MQVRAEGGADDGRAAYPEAAHTLDFSRPVALMLMGIMNMILDDEEAYAIVGRLLDALPRGSYLAFQDGSNAFRPEAGARVERIRSGSGSPIRLRSREQFARFLDGLELAEPGIVSTPRWRPHLTPSNPPEINSLSALARKP